MGMLVKLGKHKINHTTYTYIFFTVICRHLNTTKEQTLLPSYIVYTIYIRRKKIYVLESKRVRL